MRGLLSTEGLWRALTRGDGLFLIENGEIETNLGNELACLLESIDSHDISAETLEKSQDLFAQKRVILHHQKAQSC